MSFLRGILVVIVALFVRTLDCIIFPISFFINHYKKINRCPLIKDEILLYTAEELAEKIRQRQVTSEQVIKTYISRIKAVNPILNAVVEDRFDEAVEEARTVDKLIASGTLNENELKANYPLLGLPLTVKESLAVKGCSHSAGQKRPERPKASKDAVIVEKCRNAGAIPLLVSNTPELCMNWETYNSVTGRTNNPYDTRRTCGGSSGGEAALISSAASLIGLGSDICGSLRLPPFFCGIWGHKPTPCTVSIEGHYPSCDNMNTWKQFFTVGPMTRYASDLLLLYKVIAEEDMKKYLRIDEPVDLSKLRVFYMLNDQGSILTNSVSEDITTAITDAVHSLRDRYFSKIEKIHVPRMKYSSELGYITLLEIDRVDHFFKHNEKKAFFEFVLYSLCLSSYSLHSILYSILKCVTKLIYTKGYKEDLAKLRHQMINTLGDNGVLIYPCYTRQAYYHGGTIARVFDASYMTVFNALGFPATSCTVGLNRNRLPIGVQVIAAPNNDRLTLAVAKAIEKRFGGWKPPPSDEDDSV